MTVRTSNIAKMRAKIERLRLVIGGVSSHIFTKGEGSWSLLLSPSAADAELFLLVVGSQLRTRKNQGAFF